MTASLAASTSGRATNKVHAIALRAKVHALTLADRQERVPEIKNKHHAATVTYAQSSLPRKGAALAARWPALFLYNPLRVWLA